MSEEAMGGKSFLFPGAEDRTRRHAGLRSATRRAGVLSIASLCLLFTMLHARRANGERPGPLFREAAVRCWVLIDIESFSCAPCLEAFLGLCRALPARVQEEKVRGILVYDTPAGEDRSVLRSRIVLKKWRAFRKAHDIRFPAAADSDLFFRGMSSVGSVVLVVHDERDVLARYPLPLKPGQLEEIVEALTDRTRPPRHRGITVPNGII